MDNDMSCLKVQLQDLPVADANANQSSNSD